MVWRTVHLASIRPPVGGRVGRIRGRNSLPPGGRRNVEETLDRRVAIIEDPEKGMKRAGDGNRTRVSSLGSWAALGSRRARSPDDATMYPLVTDVDRWIGYGRLASVRLIGVARRSRGVTLAGEC